MTITQSATDLRTEVLDSAIGLDEFGLSPLGTKKTVWTGFPRPGGVMVNCDGFASLSALSGSVGDWTAKDQSWRSKILPSSCDAAATYPIYCLQTY